jgi:hypothetical protein
MKIRSSAWACVIWLALPGVADAQSEGRLEEQIDLIVRIVPSTGTAGSGLIIAVEQNRVRILTARHVVEAGVVMPSTGVRQPDMSARRECSRANMPVRVSFRFAQKVPVEATTAYCSDAIDAAILEVDKPAGFNDAIKPFSAQRSLTDQPGFQVYLAGLAQGTSWTPLPGSVASRALDNLQIRGVGIGAGFSGGAVFDTQFGFVGMIVRAGETTVNAIPARVLNQLLDSWQVRTTHLEGAPMQPENPRFPGRLNGQREQNARNAIRRYRGAFVSMEAALLEKAYPAIGKRPLLSLFGDASDIALVLSDCTDIDLINTPNVLDIRCAYDLNVMRKTGPPFRASSCDYVPAGGKGPLCPRTDGTCTPGRMVFRLKSSGQQNDPFEWEITKVDVDANAACPAAEKAP